MRIKSGDKELIEQLKRLYDVALNEVMEWQFKLDDLRKQLVNDCSNPEKTLQEIYLVERRLLELRKELIHFDKRRTQIALSSMIEQTASFEEFLSWGDVNSGGKEENPAELKFVKNN